MENTAQNFSPIVLIAGSLFLLLILLIFIVFFVKQYIQNVRNSERETRILQQEHSDQLLRNSIETQEKEQERFAADLHDGLITELNIFLLSNSRELKDPAVDVIQKCINTAREISHNLSPPLINDSNLIDLVEELSLSVEQKIKITLFVKDYVPIQFSLNSKMQLYRIFQELINNIIKHANSESANILIRNTSAYFCFKISDNGVGFDMDQSEQGIGLNNIKTRVQVLGGICKFKSVLNHGTTFIVLISNRSKNL
jgi:two-component system NarL family sensor kinase